MSRGWSRSTQVTTERRDVRPRDQAGGKSKQAPADQFRGDLCGLLADPFGHLWGILTHQEDVPPEELKSRAQEHVAHSPHPR